MIDITTVNDPCEMNLGNECDALIEKAKECDYHCPFYKPFNCGDWVRVGNIIYPPEEYERKCKNEKDTKQKTLYWHIKRVPVSKK